MSIWVQLGYYPNMIQARPEFNSDISKSFQSKLSQAQILSLFPSQAKPRWTDRFAENIFWLHNLCERCFTHVLKAILKYHKEYSKCRLINDYLTPSIIPKFVRFAKVLLGPPSHLVLAKKNG